MAIDWNSVRECFEKGGLSAVEVAKLFGCHPSTVRKHAAKEGWSKGGLYGGDIGAAEPKGDSSGNSGTLLNEHRKLWERLRLMVGRELEKKDSINFKEFKGTAEGILKVISSEREAWGISGEGFDSREEALSQHDITQEMDRVTVPSGAGKALERE